MRNLINSHKCSEKVARKNVMGVAGRVTFKRRFTQSVWWTLKFCLVDYQLIHYKASRILPAKMATGPAAAIYKPNVWPYYQSRSPGLPFYSLPPGDQASFPLAPLFGSPLRKSLLLGRNLIHQMYFSISDCSSHFTERAEF